MSDDDQRTTPPPPIRAKRRALSSPVGHPIVRPPTFGEDEPSGVVIPVYVPPDTIPPPLPRRGKVYTQSAQFLEAKQAALETTIAREVARALVPLTKDVEHIQAAVAEVKLARKTQAERIWDVAKIVIAMAVTYLVARR